MISIDLDQPPTRRWAPLAVRASNARALLDVYEKDLGATVQPLLDTLVELARSVLPAETFAELEGVANVIDAPLPRVVLGNLYYDVIKAGLGCSAFAVDTPQGPLHARNLDWWTTGGLLRNETEVFDCRRRGRTHYRLVGWPGFIGAFSGVAPGRFAITLNAVISDDAACIAEPVVFLLRRVLDEVSSFDEALKVLSSAPIASDCLLLLSGVREGEFVVIERTPTRTAVRRPANGFIDVTNDYRLLDVAGAARGELTQTSCRRSEWLREVLSVAKPTTSADAFALLSDERVKMTITVQQMVFCAATGRCDVRLP